MSISGVAALVAADERGNTYCRFLGAFRVGRYVVVSREYRPEAAGYYIYYRKK